MMRGEIKTKPKKYLQLEKEASLSYLQMHLATFYLPIKILSTFYLFFIFLTMVKLSSEPLFECLCHLVKRQLLIPFFTVLPSIQYIVNCAYSTAVVYPSYHGMVEYMNQCKIRVWQPYTVWFYYNGRICVC